MKPTATNETFSDTQIIETLKTSLRVTRKTLLNDGILLIVWGLVLGLANFWNYYNSIALTSWWMRNLFDVIKIVSGIGVLALTIYFIFFKNKKVRTKAAVSTQFVWFGVIIAHNLNVIISNNFFEEVNFQMLHPLQMVLIGFALFVMGGIYRYYLLTALSTIMWVAAVLAAGYELTNQFLIRGIADVLCFVVPGIFMYLASKK
jgi:hypothetical protein